MAKRKNPPKPRTDRLRQEAEGLHRLKARRHRARSNPGLPKAVQSLVAAGAALGGVELPRGWRGWEVVDETTTADIRTGKSVTEYWVRLPDWSAPGWLRWDSARGVYRWHPQAELFGVAVGRTKTVPTGRKETAQIGFAFNPRGYAAAGRRPKRDKAGRFKKVRR